MTDAVQQLDAAGLEFPEIPEENIPTPLLFRVVVVKMAPRKTSAGGIILSDDTQEAEDYATYVGKVLRKGSMAFKGKMPSNNLDMADEPYAPEVGDFVLFGKYAGQRIEVKDVGTMVLLSDDEITAVTKNPAAYRMYI